MDLESGLARAAFATGGVGAAATAGETAPGGLTDETAPVVISG